MSNIKDNLMKYLATPEGKRRLAEELSKPRMLPRHLFSMPSPHSLHLQRIDGLRQTREGYWLSPMPTPEDVSSLHQRGIRLILSAVKLPEDVLQALADHEMQQVDIPMGGTFRHADKILEVTQGVDPNTILIHCQHGADRTGCILAFLLCVRHGWSIPDAFYSVLYKSPSDCTGLAELLLERYGVRDRRYPEDKSVSFYSHSACGQLGGLKARWDHYKKLILSTIQEIQTRT